jgi:hypothetical protein
MSSFFMVPVNENGIVVDTAIQTNTISAMDPDLNLNEIFLYPHGWSTDADGAMALYNRFSIEFTRWLVRNATAKSLTLPESTLSIGIHWPSEIVEDGSNVPAEFKAVIGNVQPLTFYTMKKRADTVGSNGVYAVLRQLLTCWQPRVELPAPPKLIINLIGHSFGCKVICAALEAIRKDAIGGALSLPASLRFNVVLIEGAFENMYLDPSEPYGDVPTLPLRMLVTRSDLDTALTQAFPIAHRIVDWFGAAQPALGAGGPTIVTRTAFGGPGLDINVGPGFDGAPVHASQERLIVANLTPLHAANPAGNGWGGHHSDFNYDEVYDLIGSFLF